MIDDRRLEKFVAECWGDEVVPALTEYIRIPNKSPAFDPEWAAHGHMEEAVGLFEGWARRRLSGLPGSSLDVVRLPGRTPLLLIEVPGEGGDPVILYGHLDKQPEMTGWAEGFGPWTPRLKDEKLYGRGGGDDGYAMFAALVTLGALGELGVPHARAIVLIEACEESGSPDLPYYVDHLAGRLGRPSLVICLDSGCGDYDRLWLTTSLRGIVNGTLDVAVLEEGVHSGDASGIVPSSFRILRRLLSRLEDEETGRVRPAALHGEIPPGRLAEARAAGALLGRGVFTKFPFVAGAMPALSDPAELVLDRTWRPQLAVTGIDGLPPPENAGNVLLPRTAAKLSLRLPPNLDGEKALAVIKSLLEEKPPYGARIAFTPERPVSGWNAPTLEPWLDDSLARASEAAFGAPPGFMGEGGSIPFMAMLGEKFPSAQFVVTGVLGPHANAHGPNEFLHLPTARRLTQVIARVLADHWARPRAA